MSKGGKRRGAGAKAIDGATDVIRCTITLTEQDKADLAELGGSPFVRRAIREEKRRRSALDQKTVV